MSNDGVAYYVSPLLRAIAVPHAFSTRIGGVSPSPFDSMNLGNPTGCAVQDEDERIRENFTRLQRAIGAEDRTRAWVYQVHENRVAKFDKQTASGEKADAVVTACPSRIATVRVADCVPILAASGDGKIVASIHAGWRRIVACVIPAAIAEIQTQLQTSEPPTPREAEMKIIAAIGPSIGFHAFEVGAEVLAEFDRIFGTAAPMRRTEAGKGFVDLREAARQQLIDAGISPDSIDTTDRCTVAHRDEFFSHRRDRGVTGRMAALIGVRA